MADPCPGAACRSVDLMKEGERPDPPEAGARFFAAASPLPKGLVELYGLLAVLFVLVPEWMAAGAMRGLGDGRRGSELPLRTMAWQRIPELRLATMTMAELRQAGAAAMDLGLCLAEPGSSQRSIAETAQTPGRQGKVTVIISIQPGRSAAW